MNTRQPGTPNRTTSTDRNPRAGTTERASFTEGQTNGHRTTSVEVDRDFPMVDIATPPNTRFNGSASSDYAPQHLPLPTATNNRVAHTLPPISSIAPSRTTWNPLQELTARFVANRQLASRLEAENRQLVEQNRRLINEIVVGIQLLGSGLPVNWEVMITSQERLILLESHNTELFYRHATFQAGREAYQHLCRDHAKILDRYQKLVGKHAAMEQDYARLSRQSSAILSTFADSSMNCIEGEIIGPQEIINALRSGSSLPGPPFRTPTTTAGTEGSLHTVPIISPAPVINSPPAPIPVLPVFTHVPALNPAPVFNLAPTFNLAPAHTVDPTAPTRGEPSRKRRRND